MRLEGYNYTRPGAYFITLVAYHRENIFGRIVNGQMEYSALGQIAHDEWMRSNDLRCEICLCKDEFVVMPNHIHGIVWIADPVGLAEAGPDAVGADGVRPDTESDAVGVDMVGVDAVGADGVRPEEGARRAPQPGEPLRRSPRSLSSFVAGFKSAVTSRAWRELDISAIWQRNYHDHIIRNKLEFQRIWDYIDTNPQRWDQDQLNANTPTCRINQGNIP
jgi:REP element-mobilizing transposase RayT